MVKSDGKLTSVNFYQTDNQTENSIKEKPTY